MQSHTSHSICILHQAHVLPKTGTSESQKGRKWLEPSKVPKEPQIPIKLEVKGKSRWIYKPRWSPMQSAFEVNQDKVLCNQHLRRTRWSFVQSASETNQDKVLYNQNSRRTRWSSVQSASEMNQDKVLCNQHSRRTRWSHVQSASETNQDKVLCHQHPKRNKSKSCATSIQGEPRSSPMPSASEAN